MDASTLGKVIVAVGLTIAAAGAAVWLLGKTGIPFGQLPGDIRVERERSSFYFPIVTCIVLSVVLTVLANLVLRFFR